MNYIAGERKTAKYIDPAPLLLVDHANRRARVAGDLANKLSYTLVSDVANIVAKAIDYEGEWPTVGGINGQTLSIAEEIALGEKVRGKWDCGTIPVDNNRTDVTTGGKYEVETLEVEDLVAGIIKTESLPLLAHPSLEGDERVEFSKHVLRGLTLNAVTGAGTVSDEWNKIFPDYKFVTAEEFLTGVFGKE